MLLNELSEGNDSFSERRRSQSIGSESESESESDASRPTNLDVNGVLGAIIHGPPNKRPTNSTSSSSSSSSSAKTKGMYQRRTTLGDGRVVETRVSVRNQNKPVSKRRWTELNVKEDDEVHQEQEDDMSSLSEASVGIQSFQDNTQHDDGYADNWDDGAEADDEAVMSFTATHGCANQHQHNLPPNLSSCDPPPLGTIVEDPLEDALSRLPSLLQYESTLLELDQILSGPCTRTTYDDVVSWLELALRDNTFKDKPKLPRRKALMKRLAEKFKMPPHELVPVTLESGTENGGVDEFHPGKTVNVPRWDFQKVVISYLLDPILFGNWDNLVSTDNPWEKFEIANPKEPTLDSLKSPCVLWQSQIDV
jgi:hypothetical protein